MTSDLGTAGSELFIVDNSNQNWKVLKYLHDWCQLSRAIDIATGYFEIGSLLALDGEWQKVDRIRLLIGDEISRRTKNAFAEGLEQVKTRLDDSLETEKEKNDFLEGVPAIDGKHGFLSFLRVPNKLHRQESLSISTFSLSPQLI